MEKDLLRLSCDMAEYPGRNFRKDFPSMILWNLMQQFLLSVNNHYIFIINIYISCTTFPSKSVHSNVSHQKKVIPSRKKVIPSRKSDSQQKKVIPSEKSDSQWKKLFPVKKSDSQWKDEEKLYTSDIKAVDYIKTFKISFVTCMIYRL